MFWPFKTSRTSHILEASCEPSFDKEFYLLVLLTPNLWD